MSKHRLCLHDFDVVETALSTLQERVHVACHKPGVTIEDCLLFRVLGLVNAAQLAIKEARELAEDVL